MEKLPVEFGVISRGHVEIILQECNAPEPRGVLPEKVCV